MNNTRIRYSQTGEGLLKSRRLFTTGAGQEVAVELDLNVKQYRIVDSVTGVEVASGAGTKNNSVLKIFAKKKLMSLGVSFANESRERENSAAVV